jgi:hypothetical protein
MSSIINKLLQQHPAIQAFAQWQKKELNKSTKENALKVLEPYVNKVIEENTFSAEKKEIIATITEEHSQCYNKHKEMIEQSL